jgi:hypothetical protein
MDQKKMAFGFPVLLFLMLLLPVKPVLCLDFIRGSADGDGKVDLTDAIRTLGSLFLGEGPLECMDAADFDDSGIVDLSDPIGILTFLFLSGPQPPEPYPGCGPDTTMDSIDCSGFAGCRVELFLTVTGWTVDEQEAPLGGVSLTCGKLAGLSQDDGTFVFESVPFAASIRVTAVLGELSATAIKFLDPDEPVAMADMGILVMRERPVTPPPPEPDTCGNVVGRAIEFGCGRVFVWGDEHVRFDEYLPQSELFWLNAIAWLSENPCSVEEPRMTIADLGVLSDGVRAVLESGLGMTVRRIGGLSDLGPQEILLVQPWSPPEMRPGEWVEAGGALMTFVGGAGDTMFQECENASTWTADFGILYDCGHKAPWGPVTEFGDHPIATNLTPENAPFVNGRWVVDAPDGWGSYVVARSGSCDPPVVEDCRNVLAPYDTAGIDDVPVEIVSGEGDVHSAESLPSGPVELHIIGLYESLTSEGGDVVVTVNRSGPMVLVLSAYEPVNWIVEPGPGAEIQKVIANGYEIPTVSAPGGIEVEIHSLMASGEWWSSGYGADCDGGGTVKLISKAEAATGLGLRSFHGCNETASVVFVE